MEEKEYRVKDVINLTLDRMKQEGLYFATKDDTGYASGKELYKLDENGYVTEKTIDRIVEEVIEYMGDGAAFLVDAVNQWIEDGITEGKIGYIDNLNMEFDDNAIVEGNLEIYNGIGKEDLGTDTEPKEEEISKEAEEVKPEKKTEGKLVENGEYNTEEEIKNRLKKINKQLAYIRRRDNVSLAIGSEEEQSELYAERNKLNGKLRKIRNKKVDINNMSEDEAEELKQKLLDKGIWDGKEDSLQSALQIYRAYHMENESKKVEESISKSNVKEALTKKIISYMKSEGFEEDEAEDYFIVEVRESETGDLVAEVRAELDFEGSMKLAEILDPVVRKYDKEAYFDAVTNGIIEAVIEPKGKITESSEMGYVVYGTKDGADDIVKEFDNKREANKWLKANKERLENEGYTELEVLSNEEVWLDYDVDELDESKVEKKTLTEGVRQRLNERNEQSAGVIEQALNGITDQTSEQEAGIITKTSELFQSLSDRGYDVQVSFDNGESTSSISIGQQGANVLITITDAEQPLRAFASGNFEINDDSLKMIKSIMEVLK